jgi:branched-subunit amino acid aminotransferase/4-amino-4-deoxychorismate lyase
VTIGVFETLRVRDGRVPLLDRHAARLARACTALGFSAPPSLRDVVAPWSTGDDCVVRVIVTPGGWQAGTRPVPPPASLQICIAATPHVPYPYKVLERSPFEAALAEARAAGADDALLLTIDGDVAEGTAWTVFWWEGERLATPPLSSGVLPGVARERLADLVELAEVRCTPQDLVGRSLFGANAVRGPIPLDSIQGRAVPENEGTRWLASAFWPSSSGTPEWRDVLA